MIYIHGSECWALSRSYYIYIHIPSDEIKMELSEIKMSRWSCADNAGNNGNRGGIKVILGGQILNRVCSSI